MVGLSKQEFAERLLVQAVCLQFSDGDPYAIHLLLMSSLPTCLDILKSKGVPDIFERIIKPDQRDHFFKKFYSIASFLKHADKDPDELSEISPNLSKGNETLIVIATICFCDAFGKKIENLIVHAAMLYYIKLNPNIYQIENEYAETLKGLDTKSAW